MTRWCNSQESNFEQKITSQNETTFSFRTLSLVKPWSIKQVTQILILDVLSSTSPNHQCLYHKNLSGGNSNIHLFSPQTLLGEDRFPNLTLTCAYFSNGLVTNHRGVDIAFYYKDHCIVRRRPPSLCHRLLCSSCAMTMKFLSWLWVPADFSTLEGWCSNTRWWKSQDATPKWRQYKSLFIISESCCRLDDLPGPEA